MKAAAARLESEGFDVRMIPVSHAFHTRIVAPASEPLRKHLASVEISQPRVEILSNVSGDLPRHPMKSGTFAKQVASPVEFIAETSAYAEGVRTFVEIGLSVRKPASSRAFLRAKTSGFSHESIRPGGI